MPDLQISCSRGGNGTFLATPSMHHGSSVSARFGGTAVGPHDGHGRALGVRGAELDEYDGLARLSAAEALGKARNVPYTCEVCSFRFVGKLPLQRA